MWDVSLTNYNRSSGLVMTVFSNAVFGAASKPHANTLFVTKSMK